MPFDWLENFHRQTEKPADYAERTLAAYKLGIKAGGAIVGVRVETGPDCCQAAQELDTDKIYHPDEAPRLPLPACPRGRKCQCVYRPVMRYEQRKT
jgi:hypothetical protein